MQCYWEENTWTTSIEGLADLSSPIGTAHPAAHCDGGSRSLPLRDLLSYNLSLIHQSSHIIDGESGGVSMDKGRSFQREKGCIILRPDTVYKARTSMMKRRSDLTHTLDSETLSPQLTFACTVDFEPSSRCLRISKRLHPS
jgi:hypothetical protein